MRSRLCVFKSLFAAAGLLLGSTCATELYLRIREPAGSGGHDGITSGGLVEPSRVVHHRLRPLSAFKSRNPDTGEAVEVSVNSLGLRGGETLIPKPAGVFRVLCLGDETVLGPELPEAETLPARLQELLQARTRQRVEVINAGLPGDCPLLAWLRLREGLLGLQPDLVVLHFDMSDVADDGCYRRHTRIEAGDVPIACHHPSLAASPRERDWWRDLLLTKAVARLAGGLASPQVADSAAAVQDPKAATLWLRDNPPDWGLYVEQALAPIDEIRRAADGSYAAFVLATCPQPWQVSADASDGPGVREAAGVARGVLLANRAPFDAVTEFARKRDIPCCDASPIFRDYADAGKLFLRNSPQPSRYGQELYARTLADFLAARVPAFGGGATGGGADSPETVAVPSDGVPPEVPTALRPWEPVRYQ